MTNTSLDGYIEDESGAFDWADPDQVFMVITELLRPIGTYLFGRRLYETMSYWDAPTEENPLPERDEFARVWQSAEKIVYSRTLTAPTTCKTRIERDFDPEAIRMLKRDADSDILIGGTAFASVAIEANLVDEVHLFVNPIVIGGGKPAFTAGLRRKLELLDTRRFDTGVIHVHYRISGATA
jgi:dihydrofolate reductase